MKHYSCFFLILLLLQACASTEGVLELNPNQSMAITGKGLGQDAVINPYYNSVSWAVIENIGENPFVIRIQNEEGLLQTLRISPSETREVLIEPGSELYLDSEQKSRARVDFKQYTDTSE